MNRKDQKGSERPRKDRDTAPRYKKEGAPERNFGKRPFSSHRDENAPSRYKKEGDSGRSFRDDSPRFSNRKDGDTPSRFRKEGDSPQSSGSGKRSFGSRDDAPRFRKDGEPGRRFENERFSPEKGGSRFEKGGFSSEKRGFQKDRSGYNDPERKFRSDDRKFAPRKDNEGFRKEGDFRRTRPGFPESGSGEERGSFRSDRSYTRDSAPRSRRNEGRDSFNQRDSAPKRDSYESRKPFPSDDEFPGKRKFGRRSEPDNTRYEKKKDSFEYGKNVKPQRRPDYSEENLVKSLPEKQRKKMVSTEKKPTDLIRLNRYIANSGLCSRREADDLIESGQITVNGKTITEMGYQVKVTDVVKYGRKILNPEKLVYVLLNKPKDFITTTEDPEGRRTVMELVAKAGSERIYPVGRLDRATTGLLLFTNDGELAEKLSHPSNEIRKIYQVEIDKPLSREDFDKLTEGVELEDGFIRPDQVSVITPDQQVIGIEIHSGKNRVVRRIFEHLGYEVTQLDRTTYAGLTKKELPRGNWRFLTEKEVIRLKYMI
ncbi:pseudouridine synthase [Leadbetterella sp. DM7]|uniref:pseudouridine synthase n=1 Tax=Leadbetterella sp. DM7 TaxID=3235085 RepID=UPI00349EC573